MKHQIDTLQLIITLEKKVRTTKTMLLRHSFKIAIWLVPFSSLRSAAIFESSLNALARELTSLYNVLPS